MFGKQEQENTLWLCPSITLHFVCRVHSGEQEKATVYTQCRTLLGSAGLDMILSMWYKTGDDSETASSTQQTESDIDIWGQHIKVAHFLSFQIQHVTFLSRCWRSRTYAPTQVCKRKPPPQSLVWISTKTPFVRGSLRQQMCSHTTFSQMLGFDQCRGGKTPQRWWRYLPPQQH